MIKRYVRAETQSGVLQARVQHPPLHGLNVRVEIDGEVHMRVSEWEMFVRDVNTLIEEVRREGAR